MEERASRAIIPLLHSTQLLLLWADDEKITRTLESPNTTPTVNTTIMTNGVDDIIKKTE